MSIVDICQLDAYKNTKLLRCQKHPSRDLFIWNYTDLAQSKQQWDDITTLARALVTTSTGTIVARSFKKFHNIEEHRHDPTDEFVVYEKLDGSLIIAFWHVDTWIVASRGSFVSDQAKHAHELLSPHFNNLDKHLTYSFEIIYPENRVVVNYEDRDELVLLTAFDAYGTEYPDARIPSISKVATFCYHDYTQLKQLDWSNSEGFVVRFSNGHRCKIKFNNYLDMHRIVTNINGQTVWAKFCENPDELVMDDIPDEFMEWVQNKWTQYKHDFERIYLETLESFESIKASSTTRSEFGKLASNHKHSRLLFMMLDQRQQQLKKTICEMLRPCDGHLDAPFQGKTKAVAVPMKATHSPRTITLLIGPSGSGKTTWCTSYLKDNSQTIRVNRDTIRAQLFAESAKDYYSHPDLVKRVREDLVTRVEYTNIQTALDSGFDVVVDNTNLQKKYVDGYIKRFPYEVFRVKIFDVPLEECIARDAERDESHRVGADVIKKQYANFVSIRNYTPKDPWRIPHITCDSDLPPGYIFDVDGTLADNSQRSPYDWHLVDKDAVVDNAKTTLLSLHSQGYKIAICTGRDGVAEAKTKEWLSMHGIPYDYFYIRPIKNKEPDWKVKEVMWKDIATKMRIIAMFDDRNTVVRHARLCGIPVYQVAEGDF